jgi:hypothetical protein
MSAAVSTQKTPFVPVRVFLDRGTLPCSIFPATPRILEQEIDLTRRSANSWGRLVLQRFDRTSIALANPEGWDGSSNSLPAVIHEEIATLRSAGARLITRLQRLNWRFRYGLPVQSCPSN